MNQESKTDRNLIGNFPEVSPSHTFTQQVMDAIAVEPKTQPLTTYTPVIPRMAWYVMGSAFLIFLVFALIFSTGNSNSVLKNIDFSVLQLPEFLQSSVVTISLASTFLLLLIERFLQQRHMTT